MVSRFDRDPKASGPVVQGFTKQGFSVDGGVYEGLLLTPRRAEEWSAHVRFRASRAPMSAFGPLRTCILGEERPS